MSREIKFRGKCLDTGSWRFGDLNHRQNNKPFIRMHTNGGWLEYEIDPKTVSQYTGLKDKNGKGIYEGDILRFIVNHEEFLTDPVAFKHELSAYAAGIEVGGWYPEDLGVMTDVSAYEVIGNVHDNPELCHHSWGIDE